MTDPFYRETFWRIMVNFWTIAIFLFIIINFWSVGEYDHLAGTFGILYTSVLTLYIGTKEFDRWYEKHTGRHPGEWFVIIWTALIFGLFALSIFWGAPYRVPSDVVAVYIAVVSLFALTQKSKQLYRDKKKK